MGDLSIGKKMKRALEFAAALGDPYVRRKLAPNGFNDEELAKGLRLANAASSMKLSIAPGLDMTVLGLLDAWENHWFPIVEIVLRTNFLGVHELVFRNLTQTDGAQVIVSVTTLLDRLDSVAKPKSQGGHPQGAEARKLLVKRGLTDAVVEEARGLLGKVGMVPEGAELVEAIDVDPDATAEAEALLWNWYLEWSQIARTVIHDRRTLRSLGFLRRMRRADGREVDVVVDDDDVEDVEVVSDPAPQPAPVTPEPEPTS